jgi:hypothetical protein
MTERREMARNVGREFASAITVRLGMGAGGVLGGFAGYWIGILSTPAREVRPWLIAAAGAAGLVTAWAVLTWLARKHRRAGVIAGGILTLAAVAALIAWFARPSGG